jgi:DNA-directed RNA polymerase specialized sigma24 family protein
LADALADLSADSRDVIILRSIEERDWGEVAEKMARSEGAVRLLWAREGLDIAARRATEAHGGCRWPTASASLK